MKLAFLIRQETALREERTFYDFLPYKFGPFSFTLYHELSNLSRDGYLIPDEDLVALNERNNSLAEEKIDELPVEFREAVENVVRHYAGESRAELLEDVYARYPWYATKSELTDRRRKTAAITKQAEPAAYTTGYEGKSVDAFFNDLLFKGIRSIIDVRANPVSRRYGFSKKQFGEIANRLVVDYRHMPELGIPSEYRADLTDFQSYQRLLSKYESEMLPNLEPELNEVSWIMLEAPTVLVCVEKDARCCHRGRLAEAVSRLTGLEVKHI